MLGRSGYSSYLTRLLLGINKVDANLKDQLVLVEGTAAPSSIVTAIQQTGRDAILRGSGTSNSKFLAWLRNMSRMERNFRSSQRDPYEQVRRCVY